MNPLVDVWVLMMVWRTCMRQVRMHMRTYEKNTFPAHPLHADIREEYILCSSSSSRKHSREEALARAKQDEEAQRREQEWEEVEAEGAAKELVERELVAMNDKMVEAQHAIERQEV